MGGVLLLLEGGDTSHCILASGATPLHAALHSGHYQIAALLLVAGAQLDAVESPHSLLSLKLCEQRAARRHRGAGGDAPRRCAQQLWCWGTDRSDFVTGLVTSGKKRVDPTPIHALQHERIVACAAGKRHSLCISETGVVFGWGVFGESTVLEPTPLSWAARLGRVVGIAAGDDVTVALTSDGRVFTCAGGSPHARCLLRKHNVVGIACGDRFALAWTSRGELYTWGANDAGQLGSSDAKALREDAPCIVRFHSGKVQPRVVRAAGGACVGAALDDDGALWLWGNGRAAPRRAYVGESDGSDVGADRSEGWIARRNEATKTSRRHIGFTAVAAAAAHVVALDTNGEVWVYSGEGPVRIELSLPAGIAVESVATSATRSIAVLRNGTLACFDAAASCTAGVNCAPAVQVAPTQSPSAATRRKEGRRNGGAFVSDCEREAAVIACVCCATAVSLGALHTICIVRADEPEPLRSENCVWPSLKRENKILAQPPSLKFLCASKLARHVDVENVVAMANAAQSVGARELAAYCREWITFNADLVFSVCARCARGEKSSFGALFRALAAAESQAERPHDCDAMLAVARAAWLESDVHRVRSTSLSLDGGGGRLFSPPETPFAFKIEPHSSHNRREQELVTSSPPTSPVSSAAGFDAPISSALKRSQRRARSRSRSKSLCSPSPPISASVSSPLRMLSPLALAPSMSPHKIPMLRLDGASEALAGRRRSNASDAEDGRASAALKQQRMEEEHQQHSIRRATLEEIMDNEVAAAAKPATTSMPRREPGKRHVPWGGVPVLRRVRRFGISWGAPLRRSRGTTWVL